jgi:hypothetical protein
MSSPTVAEVVILFLQRTHSQNPLTPGQDILHVVESWNFTNRGESPKRREVGDTCFQPSSSAVSEIPALNDNAPNRHLCDKLGSQGIGGMTSPANPSAEAASANASCCPNCGWSLDAAAKKCPFCGTAIKLTWQRSGRIGIFAHTILAAAKLWYVPALYWLIAVEVFISWLKVSPFYSQNHRLGLQHWFGARYGMTIPHPATMVLLLPFVALLWIVAFWPEYVNRAGSLVNGFCVWVLYFPAPLAMLLILRPNMLGPVGEMVSATIRYLHWPFGTPSF